MPSSTLPSGLSLCHCGPSFSCGDPDRIVGALELGENQGGRLRAARLAQPDDGGTLQMLFRAGDEVSVIFDAFIDIAATHLFICIAQRAVGVLDLLPAG